MKTKLITLLILITVSVSAQKYRPDYIGCSLMFVAGGCKATTDVLRSDYSAFQKAFPNANPQFWDYNISWTNKYKNGDPAHGAKFWQSTGILSPITDGFHLIEMPRKYAPIFALTLKIGDKNKPIKHYVYDLILYSASYGLGFNLMWKAIYNKK